MINGNKNFMYIVLLLILELFVVFGIYKYLVKSESANKAPVGTLPYGDDGIYVGPPKSGTPQPKPTTGGQFCGGIAGIACPKGYYCKYDGDYADAGGTCIPNTPKNEHGYVCPSNGWVDCMPSPDIYRNGDSQFDKCSEDAFAWYAANCPGYQGVAY